MTLCVVVLGAAYYSLPDPRLRTVLRASGETITVVVANSDLAGFRIGRMRAVPEEAADVVGDCIAGVLTPFKGTVVTYSRVGRAGLVVRVAPPEGAPENETVAVLINPTEDGAETSKPFTGTHRFVTANDCSIGAEPTRLPIQGVAEFGREYAPPTAKRDAMAGYLSEGSLTVYGQAIDYVLRVVPLRTTTIYEVMKIDVPSGSRVGAIAEGGAPPVWWGLARIEPDRSGFAIDASTSARLISFQTPGSTGDGGIIRLGTFAQVTKDPNVIWLQLVAALGIGGISLAFKARQTIQNWRRLQLADRRRLLRARRKRKQAASTMPAGAALAVLLALLIVPPARAEPVRLLLGGSLTGQGWMFRDRQGTCRIATAGHNLDRAGALITPTAIDRRGEEFPTAEPVRPEATLDLGFLTARPARGCSTIGLSETNVDERLARAPAAFLDLVLDRATSTIALVRRQRGMDEQGGRILLFERTSEAVDLSQGLSGGAVIDGTGTALGIANAVMVENGRLRAIRIDVAAGLLDALVLRVPAAAAAVSGWSVQNGRSTDPALGPDRMLDHLAPGWRVTTDRGFVMVTARLPKPKSLSAVSLAFGPDTAGAIDDIQIQIQAGFSKDEAAAWSTIRRCPVPPGGLALRCAFAGTDPVEALRLILRTRTKQADLYAFSFE